MSDTNARYSSVSPRRASRESKGLNRRAESLAQRQNTPDSNRGGGHSKNVTSNGHG